jgi:hypothetical protein
LAKINMSEIIVHWNKFIGMYIYVYMIFLNWKKKKGCGKYIIYFHIKFLSYI